MVASREKLNRAGIVPEFPPERAPPPPALWWKAAGPARLRRRAVWIVETRNRSTSFDMRYLITGGAGFIGRHLVRRLLTDANAEVVVLDNLRRSRALSEPGCRFIEGDVRDQQTVAAAMRGVEVVYHLAAQSNVMGAEADRDYAFSTNVVGTFRVLDAAKAAGAKKVVFASSREVYGDSDTLPVAETAPAHAKNYYGASKLAAEAYCRVFTDDGLPVVVLRLANVYGPGDRDRVIPLFLTAALRNQPLTLYGGRQVIDFLWIDDAVNALHRASSVDASAGPFNLGSGAGVTVRQLAEMIDHHIPGGVRIRQLPPRRQEVTGYVADIGRALRHGLLPEPTQPLSHLGRVLAATQAELSGEVASVQGCRVPGAGRASFSTVRRHR